MRPSTYQKSNAQQNQFRLQHPSTFRACSSGYITFGIIAGLPLSLYLIAPLFGRHILWGPVGIMFLAGLSIFIWLSSFKVTLDDDKLTYKTLFSKTSSLLYSEVAEAKLESGIGNAPNRYGPTVRIIVKPLASSERQPIVINAKLLSRKNTKQILAVLNR